MTATEFLSALDAAGVTVSRDGTSLLAAPRQAVHEGLADAIRWFKPQLLAGLARTPFGELRACGFCASDFARRGQRTCRYCSQTELSYAPNSYAERQYLGAIQGRDDASRMKVDASCSPDSPRRAPVSAIAAPSTAPHRTEAAA